jgi:hypothetical protein
MISGKRKTTPEEVTPKKIEPEELVFMLRFHVSVPLVPVIPFSVVQVPTLIVPFSTIPLALPPAPVITAEAGI